MNAAYMLFSLSASAALCRPDSGASTAGRLTPQLPLQGERGCQRNEQDVAWPDASPHISVRPAGAGPAPDSTAVRLLYGADEPELTELMSRVLQVEKYRLQFQDARLAGRVLHLSYQEFRRGRPGKERELVAPMLRELVQCDSLGRFDLTVYARQKSRREIETRFVLSRAIIPRTFAVAARQAKLYSLRPDIHRSYPAADQTGRPADNPATDMHLPIGPKLPLLVYTTPFEAEKGIMQYCGLAQSGVPVAEWYRRFRIRHYVVYYLQID